MANTPWLRILTAAITPPLRIFMAYLSNTGNILLLAFGFGFVIFWHELGHFLAAKWADVKVEQFAVGFGQALLSWRKGLGFRWGSTQEDFQRRVRTHIESSMTEAQRGELTTPTEQQMSAAAAEINISETEYRLNWIPLGGYVKMLGQDDMKPGQTVADPRSYNNKTISQRMVIVSAGVIMNVILAGIGFMYIFTVGFVVPKPMVGMVVPGSPAQNTFKLVSGKHVISPLAVGDEIQSLNGKWQSDFEKIKLNTALLIAGDTVPMDVVHADGSYDHLFVTPAKASADSEFPAIGMGEYPTLKGPPIDARDIAQAGEEPADFLAMANGDVITAVNGKPVAPDQYYVLDEALQKAAGKAIEVTITDAAGKTRTAQFQPHFLDRFGDEPINFAGMEMLTRIESIQANSPVIAKDQPQPLKSDDVVINLRDPSASGSQWPFPTQKTMIETINKAGEQKSPLVITVQRGDKKIEVNAKPTVKLQNGKVGFGISLAMDEALPVVAGVMDGSSAADAKVQPGSQLQSVNGTPVQSWFDVNNIMATLKPDQPIELTATLDGTEKQYSLKGLTQSQIDDIRSNRLKTYGTALLMPAEYARKAPNLLVAAKWGCAETRDAILQVYQTVRSMVRKNISPSELSGPVGILTAGYMVAEKGTTRLVWFLSIISANLAVMNFLPIPIVDGGLFTFLIIEKIKGSPISPRVQAIAQVVGLALLLSVFLFATYQDVFVRLPVMLR
jgi:regulator of sigma E protease